VASLVKVNLPILSGMVTAMRGAWRIVTGILLLSAVACSSLPSSPVQPQGNVGSSSGGSSSGGSTSSIVRAASAAVMAYWSRHQSFPSGKTTSLLVLWRGSPGWMTPPFGGGGGGNGSHDQETIFAGGATLSLSFDYDRGILSLLAQQFSLTTTNVVLVDGANSADGSRIVGTQWVDPAATDSATPPNDAINAIIKRTPELYDYLRCGEEFGDQGPTQRILCDQVRPE
jgi:hypothetical protein